MLYTDDCAYSRSTAGQWVAGVRINECEVSELQCVRPKDLLGAIRLTKHVVRSAELLTYSMRHDDPGYALL
jgi:hypothetical protein